MALSKPDLIPTFPYRDSAPLYLLFSDAEAEVREYKEITQLN